MRKIWELGKAGFEKVSSVGRALVMGACALVVAVAGDVAVAADTIPEMPIDFGALATEATTVVGTVLAAVAGVIIVIALCRMGFRFLSRAFSGSV